MTVSVLLVEDAPQLREVVATLLHSLGEFAVVGEASTEAQARQWLQDNPNTCDLAIIDLILQQGTGMSVIAKCKETPGTHVVVFSDYATPGIRKHCMALGADAVFEKSRQMTEFIDYCARLAPVIAQPKSPEAGPPAI